MGIGFHKTAGGISEIVVGPLYHIAVDILWLVYCLLFLIEMLYYIYKQWSFTKGYEFFL